MAFTPANGTEGRVRVAVGNNIVAGIHEWSIEKNVAAIPVNHFELTADSDGVVWSAFKRGLGTATAQISGHYDVDATLKTEGGTSAIRAGVDVVLDLLFTRTPFGYIDLAGFFTKFLAGSKVENSMASFSATVQLTGLVPVAA